MGGSKSSSSSSVSTSTTTVSDSYNSTVNRIANLSNVGNAPITIGAGGDLAEMPLSNLLPFAVLAVVGVLGILFIWNRS